MEIQLRQFHHHLSLRLRQHHSRLKMEKLVHHHLRHHHRLLLYSHLAKQKILLHQHHPYPQVKYYLQLHRLHHRHHRHHQCYQVHFLLDYLVLDLLEEYYLLLHIFLILDKLHHHLIHQLELMLCS